MDSIIRSLHSWKKNLLVCLTLFVFSSAYSQTKQIDSLQNTIPSLNGKAKVDALVEYARSLVSINYNKSKEASHDAYELADRIHYGRGKVTSLISEAVNEFSVFNNKRSRQLFKESIALSQRLKAKDLEGYAMAYLGLNYQNANQLDTALIYYNRSFELLKDNSNPFYLSFLYLTLSDYYGILGESETQFSYLEKCWSIREKFKLIKYLPYIGTRMAAYYVNKGNFSQAKDYLSRTQKALGNDTVNNESIALINQQRAIVYAREGNILLALTLSDKARTFYEENSFPLELTNLLIDIGEVLEEISNYEAGLKNLFEALKIAEYNHFEFEIIKIWIRIAWIYYDINEFKTAKAYIEKIMLSPSLARYPKEEAAASNILGLTFLSENKIPEAMSHLNRSLAIRKRINYQIGVAASLYNIGLVFEELNNLDSAVYYHHQSLALEEATGHAVGIAYSNERLGALFTKLHQYQKADKYLIKAESLSKQIKAGAILIDVFKDQRDLLMAQGKLEKAINYSILYEQLKDSVFSNTLSNRIASLESVNQTEKKNNEIILLNKTKQLQENELLMQKGKLRQQWYILTTALLGLILLSYVIFLLYRSIQRTKKLNREIQAQSIKLMLNNNLLHEQQEEISSQHDRVAEQNLRLAEAKEIIEQQHKKIKLRNENLEVQVEKRTKDLVEYNYKLEQFAFISSHNLRGPVARILGLGQLLELPGKNEQDEKTIKEKLIITTKEMDRVVKDLNSILEIRDHSSDFFSEINLAEELELVKVTIEGEMDQAKAVLHADFSNAPIVKTVRSYLDSMLYNLISNAIKYQNPQHPPIISITSEYRGNFTCIIVSDNGIGIDLAKHGNRLFTIHARFHDHVEGRGLGLYLIKKQLDSLGGKIEVTSELNKGTSFFLYLKNS